VPTENRKHKKPTGLSEVGAAVSGVLTLRRRVSFRRVRKINAKKSHAALVARASEAHPGALTRSAPSQALGTRAFELGHRTCELETPHFEPGPRESAPGHRRSELDPPPPELERRMCSIADSEREARSVEHGTRHAEPPARRLELRCPGRRAQSPAREAVETGHPSFDIGTPSARFGTRSCFCPAFSPSSSALRAPSSTCAFVARVRPQAVPGGALRLPGLRWLLRPTRYSVGLALRRTSLKRIRRRLPWASSRPASTSARTRTA